MNGNILIGDTFDETRREILSLVKDHVIKQLASQEIEYEVIADKSPEETISLLEKLADGMDENNTPIFHLVVIDDLYDYQTLELGRRFEYAINQLGGNPDVLIIATSKLSSADIITDIIQRAFPYRITSMQTSAMNSKIFIDQYDAAYIGRNEVIIRGFEDELKLCTLGIEENEDGDANLRKKMLEEYKVFLEVERSWKKHMSAFREIAK